MRYIFRADFADYLCICLGLGDCRTATLRLAPAEDDEASAIRANARDAFVPSRSPSVYGSSTTSAVLVALTYTSSPGSSAVELRSA